MDQWRHCQGHAGPGLQRQETRGGQRGHEWGQADGSGGTGNGCKGGSWVPVGMNGDKQIGLEERVLGAGGQLGICGDE